MKKIFIFLTALSLGLVGTAQLEFSNADTEVSGFSGTAAAELISSHIDVTNSSSETLEISCTREILFQEAEDADERFCWGGLCYENDTETSLFSQTFPPEYTVVSEGSQGFTGYYAYNGEDGACQIKYTFFDVDNEETFSEIIVNFCVSNNGECDFTMNTEEVASAPSAISVSPNPATNNFFISYNLTSPANNAKLIIRDTLGKEVKSLSINSQTGLINFNAMDFNTGMYFYSIKNKGQIENTKRLVISN